MTDLDPAALAANIDLTRQMIDQARLVTPDASQQAMAMLTAAVVLIEREVGRDHAPATLQAMLEPTLADWGAQPVARSVQ